MAVDGLTRRSSATVDGRRVDIDVRHEAGLATSHIVVTVDAASGESVERAEYVTDHSDCDQALSAGFEIAHMLIDAQRRGKGNSYQR